MRGGGSCWMYERKSSAARTPSVSLSPLPMRFAIWTCSTHSSPGAGGDQPLCVFQTLLPCLETEEN
eukprot:2349352-Alexandrium_andersonii.AAC.1